MDVFEELVRLRREGRKCALATIIQARGSIPSYASAKMLVRDDGSILGTVGGGCVEAEVWRTAKEVMETEKPRLLSFALNQDAASESGLLCGGQVEIYVEPVLPEPRAILFGAGHISRSLAKIASLAGFAVTVVDDRESFASREHFPDAEQIHAEAYETAFEKLAIDENCYLVIVTRGHRDDMRVLRLAVATPARYIAMVGSRRKVIETVEELKKEGIPGAAFERLHAPMGLDIGAVTPEEIAVAVVAEMIAVRRRADGRWRQLSKSIFVQERFRELLT
ncbi:MAG: XdhC family protein [Bryobacterales bacterium]|nr:XdhC family protein [Bryobacteraceae bacterium]MDW8131341.1 XdhC family protein [Bryobacterales bacterium]